MFLYATWKPAIFPLPNYVDKCPVTNPGVGDL